MNASAAPVSASSSPTPADWSDEGDPSLAGPGGLAGPGLTTTFLFAGGTVSVVCLLSVVWQYLWYPRLRRAPLNLLFWRSVADLLFTSQFCVTYIIPAFRVDEAEGGDWERDSPAVCTFLAFLTQFTALAAELWLLVICFDLLIQLTQPFRQTASTAGYHVLVWTVALASGVALVADVYARSSNAHSLSSMGKNVTDAVICRMIA